MASAVVRLFLCLGALGIGCAVMLAIAGGQDMPGWGKAKKDKDDKWVWKGDKDDPEAKAVFKTAEKATKISETEREKWLKELNKAYPGRVSPGLTDDDITQWFGLLAGNGAEWRREDSPDHKIVELFDRAAARINLEGVPSLRRNEFMDYAWRFLRPGFSPIWNPPDPIGEAAKMFRKLDQDDSGFLEPPEWPDRLRAEVPRIDRDGDGRINFPEYRAYFEGRVVLAVEFGPAFQPLPLPVSRLPERSPVPSRPERPTQLPPWVVDLDTDKDGQIALHEWRKAGQPLGEFMAMDLDRDGLLPPEEYLRFARAQRERERLDALSAAP